LLFASLISAGAGCFTYTDSALFCNDLELEPAQQECSFFPDCNLEQYFSSDSCSNNPICQKVLCKSTCREEFLGKCSAGEIPSEERMAWCSPGCCQFEHFGGEYCQNKNNKWLCEIEAKNKNAPKFLFDISVNTIPCEQRCGGSKVEEFLQLPSEDNTSLLVSPAINLATEQKGTSGGFYIGILIVILVIIVVYLWKKGKLLSAESKVPLPPSRTRKESSYLPRIVSQLFSPVKKNPKIKHHSKEKERQKFFLDSGMEPLAVKSVPATSQAVNRLKNLTKDYPLAPPPSKKSEAPWARLNKITQKPEELTSSTSRVEKKVLPSPQKSTPEDLESLRKLSPSKKSTENPALEQLRKISARK